MNIQNENTFKNIEFNGYGMKEYIDSEGVIWRNFPCSNIFISINGAIKKNNSKKIIYINKNNDYLYGYGICFVPIPEEYKDICKLDLKIKCKKFNLSTCKWSNGNSTNSRVKTGGKIYE